MLRVRVNWSGFGGTPFLSTHYFDGNTQLEADNAVTAVGTFWGAADGVIDNQLTWATDPEVSVIDLATGQPTNAWSTTPQTGTGAVSSNSVPFLAQGLIRWRTGFFFGGREIRGRTFVPGITATGTGEGVPTTSVITTLNTAAAALIADPATVLVVWSRANAASSPARSASTWNQFAALRSRRPG